MAKMSYYHLQNSDFIKSNTSVYDKYISGDKLGNILYIPDKYIVYKKGFFQLYNLTEKQKNMDISGSFVFKGTNEIFFNHLINSIVIGKVLKTKRILLDATYLGSVSSLFMKILSNSLFGTGDSDV